MSSLVERLRNLAESEIWEVEQDGELAADRIEQLEKELAEVRASLEHAVLGAYRARKDCEQVEADRDRLAPYLNHDPSCPLADNPMGYGHLRCECGFDEAIQQDKGGE